ncbi:DUF305 domain-containing protein [Nocardia blacklockiae]|uniref:DUF305 domain-containing protein n=1 Tax=Nocardia blacklockiae TaxID=480036 RepID=UPI0018931169|nr:DUF305 domain-containing protein [Nocardia blacklockiae]MBF6176321.1 DUF305 domain-containing protein [Nocardia blacklockiae]
MRPWPRLLAFACGAVLLLVLGAALRPLVLPESHTAAPVLNETEIGFAQDMTAHHQQAVQIVQRLDPGVDPAVQRLARQIDQTQRVEIGTMLGWLRLANAAPMPRDSMAWMAQDTDAAAAHHHSGAPAQRPPAMPGLASRAELDALSAARGRDAEVLFLQLMYRHHQGGVTMAQAADRAIPSGPVKETIRGMITGQSQECGLMAVMLAQRDAQPLP